mmetsp:Transcript_12763/g.23933  ORF Transcript_12763/g.23933 Transcript_12763/m.23933 type:complete len:433 (+) Transcript_12763:494-1792(+)
MDIYNCNTLLTNVVFPSLSVQCINCSACSYFAPHTFKRAASSPHHIVYHQPGIMDDSSTTIQQQEFDDVRAALAACPVSAIRASSPAEMDDLTPKKVQLSRSYAINTNVNGLPLPFPRPLFLSEETETITGTTTTVSSIWLLGHHSDKSFGALPYLVKGRHGDRTVSVMVDVPQFSNSAISAIESLGIIEPDYMFLTHIDDTAQHNEWKKYFAKLKRIFHANDLGENNWIGDESLEEVEVLIREESNAMHGEMLAFSLDGKGPIKIDCNHLHDEENGLLEVVDRTFAKIFKDFDSDFLILHTPGHSPGSISLLCKPSDSSATATAGGTLFTGDTFAYSTRGRGQMTGFPRYGNDLLKQSNTLECFTWFCSQYDCIAPGHGHPRNYRDMDWANILGWGEGRQKEDDKRRSIQQLKLSDLRDAISELVAYNNHV